MNASELTTNEKIALVKGMGSWHTNDLSGKLPTLHLSDGPHGLRTQSETAKNNNDSIVATCFPTASAIACSFDKNLIEEMANAIANQAKEAGVSILLGPGVNMKRSPLCGRNFEYFSEDPYLTGELATSYVKGIQNHGVGTSLKHFAGNSQETHRMTANSMIDERALREIYLKAFEKVVKDANPATIMASYNLLNGKPACENEWLLTQVLRNEWGYNGLVMSDWGACVDAGACLNAGMDLEMPDSLGNHDKNIKSALENGSLSEEALNRAANNVLRLIEEYHPNHQAELKELPNNILDTHHVLSKKISVESAVLLKNNGLLPLNNPRKVIVIGELAMKMRVQGGGSSHIHTENVPNILDAFSKQNLETIYLQGYDSDASISLEQLGKKDLLLLENTLATLKQLLADNPEIPVLLFGGLTDQAEGEGYDRTSLQLPINQKILFQKIKEITKNVVYISFGGSPYDMTDISYAGACLNMYLGGEGAAEACVDLLLGKANPSGRLAETWPLSEKDTPCFEYFGRQNPTANDVPYCESLFIGYRYYDSFQVPVQYPFGHGLSYTRFYYQNMSLSKCDDTLKITVEVTNTGAIAGKETVLVFVKNPKNGLIRANRELRGFQKVMLEPGETKSVEILLDNRSFEIYNCNINDYSTIGGEYTIEISKAVGDVLLSMPFYVTGEALPVPSKPCPSYFYKLPEPVPEHPVTDRQNKILNSRFNHKEFALLYGKPFSHFSNVKPGEFTAKNSLFQMENYSAKARRLIRIGKIATRLITKKPLSDPESKMLFEGILEGNIDSVCNQSGGIVSKKTIDKIIASANKGAQHE